jgi:PAS domain S-box-containing protein
MSGRNLRDPGGASEAPARPDESGRFGLRRLTRFAYPWSVEPRSRRDPIAWELALLGLVMAALAVWWLSPLRDASTSSRISAAAVAFAIAILTQIALRLWRSRRLDLRTRRAWAIMYLALIFYLLGALIHVAQAYVPVLAFLGPLATGLELTSYALVAVGLGLLPKPAGSVYDLALFCLDIAIVASSAGILLWHFDFFTTAQNSGRGVVDAFGVTVFPTTDLALVFAIGALIVRGLRDSTRVAVGVVGTALLSVFVGDMISGNETLAGTYMPGGLSGLFYAIAWLGFALALYVQWRIEDSDRPIQGLADYSRSLPWLPFLAIAVAFFAPAIHDWNDLDLLQQHIPASGVLIGLVVARMAVTARQNATLAAAERERLAAAVEQAAEAIVTTDRAGKVTYVNPAFTRMMGYPADEVLGQSHDYLRDAADPERLAEMHAALGRGEAWEGRLTTRRRDGARLEVDATVAPMRDSAGSVNGTVEVARDISRERALEAQLAQAQRMEAVGRLAGGIAHDFNNILTAINGFGELAVAELPDDHPVAADLDQILKASERATRLTRSLLAFAGRQVMQPRLIDMNEVVDGLTQMLGRLIGEDVLLVVDVEPRLGLTVADGAQLEQVVLNLAVNARDAMPGGGTLTISTANVDLDLAYARDHLGASAGQFVALKVADTGVGMEPAVMEHAFEPFFTTKARGKGTGLGLPTAIGIVQQSGGFVDVRSEPGVGTSLTVFLPRYQGTARLAGAVEAVVEAAGGNETILVAEDERAVREFVERVLTGAGYRVVAAANGADARAAAATLPAIDLLFTDVVMPGMSGVELAAGLAAAHPGLPVIYASGYSDGVVPGPAVADRLRYLPKPFTAEALLARVREVLDRRMPPGDRA